jgi:hypothetical protein
MNTHKRLHRIVIILCLWLPLQAIAGQWVHCAQVSNALTANQTEIESQMPPCHASAQTISSVMADVGSIEENTTQSSGDLPTCKHCQFACYWHCVLVMGDAFSQWIEVTPFDNGFKNPLPAQPWLALPQKPPQAFPA